MPPPDDPRSDPTPLEPGLDYGPSLLRMAIVRVLVVAVMAGAMLVGLRAWHTATVALVVVVAAWLLGRVD
jgi:hypothetical protein